MSVYTASASDAKRDAVRAIRALAEVIDHIDSGQWRAVMCDDLPHIEANVEHIRELGLKVARGEQSSLSRETEMWTRPNTSSGEFRDLRRKGISFKGAKP